MKTSKKITINEITVNEKGEETEIEKELTIRKIPIGKFAELMMAIEKLPSIVTKSIAIDELENLNNEILLTKLPALLASSQDEIFNLVSVASGVDKNKISTVGFDEFFDIILAIIELNNIQAIVNKVKNLGKAFKAKVQ